MIPGPDLLFSNTWQVRSAKNRFFRAQKGATAGAVRVNGRTAGDGLVVLRGWACRVLGEMFFAPVFPVSIFLRDIIFLIILFTHNECEARRRQEGGGNPGKLLILLN